MKIKTLTDLEKLKKKGLSSIYPGKTKIAVGMGTCGMAAGAAEGLETISKEVKRQKLDVVVSQTGCLGLCQEEPLIDILAPGKPRLTYSKMTTEKIPQLISALAKGEIKKEWVLGKMEEEEYLIEDKIRRYSPKGGPEGFREIPSCQDLDFYKKQRKIALRNCGFIDPEKIDEYIARGGYFALYKVLGEMEPEEVIGEVTKSGLRGRGGGGFPTGRKWNSCRQAPGDVHYVICNADEGDPGAYMDRSILEGDPHSVLEGMIIGAYAIGSKEGYIYVRAEYPLAIEKLRIAIKQAEDYGLLGKNIFNSGFDFTIKINRGGGAFVCGESTALMASLEGRVGEPRSKYIHTVESGLWDKPTNLNNVETWANVPAIIARGADWFSKIGTEESKGTKVFSLVGKIKNTGLVEVPMGITLREIIEDIGGGIPEGKRFKAVQTGGPSGGCIPAGLIDLPVDYERLTQAGSMMGSGGMIVMDENTCMVDVAKYFLSFLKEESCGKCTPCREGVERMFEMVTDISEGKGKESDIALLEELSSVVSKTSLCALGGSAPNPVLTTLRYFRDEYKAHIEDKRCPAGVCRPLIQYLIDAEKCTGCTKCAQACPVEAIAGEKKEPHTIDQSKCIKCGVCIETCPFEAIRIE